MSNVNHPDESQQQPLVCGIQDIPDEPPRKVYLAGCAEIARAFEVDGFSYARSRQMLSRKSGFFRHQIAFQSSHHNSEGETILIWVHAWVYSATLVEWHKANHSKEKGGFVAGGQLGNLLPEPSWYEWNIADPARRKCELDDAIQKIRATALPFFAAFETPSHLIKHLLVEDQAGLGIVQAVEFVLCFGLQTQAEMIMGRFFRQRPDMYNEYLRLLTRNQAQGHDAQVVGGYAAQLAETSLRFNLSPAL